jgi:hypothetical protein
MIRYPSPGTLDFRANVSAKSPCPSGCAAGPARAVAGRVAFQTKEGPATRQATAVNAGA